MKTFKLKFLLVFLLTVGLTTSCDTDNWEDYTPPEQVIDQPDEEEPDGEETDGEETDGEETDGEETDGEETDEEETFALTAMSFTIRAGNADLQQVADLIDKYAADVVVLRQVDKNTGRSGNVDQAGVIADYIDMEYLFIRGIDHDGGEYGIAILSKYPMSEPQAISMVRETGSEDRPFGFFTIEIEEGFEVVFGGTQFDDGWNMEDRALNNPKFANEILSYFEDEERPIILGGSFAWSTGTEAHIEILRSQFTSACTECALTSPVNEPVIVGDHFMYKGTESVEIAVTDYLVADEDIGNQTPVIAKFEITRTEE